MENYDLLKGGLSQIGDRGKSFLEASTGLGRCSCYRIPVSHR